ncbi:MAG TPA: hypothetical protein VMM16_14135 [Verrucomicrobiae bacterium]|nr:hypothetical protein [Verrucomicrobiae bacterium]
MLRRIAFVFVVLALLLAISGPAFAQKTAVQRVVVVKTDNLPAYLEGLDRVRGIMKRMGVPGQIRVFQGTYAGTGAGTIIVTVEYPSMAALADADAKTAADKEYQAWLKDMAKLRTITEDSIYKEL